MLIIGLLLFVGLIVVHEFGHFLVARRNGVEVEEFGIGFPPRAWKRRTKAGFTFSLNWLPIGGFVKLKGENDAATEPGSFGAARFAVKAKIMLAGVGMNLLAAFVIFMVLAWVGMPQTLDNQFRVHGDSKVVQQRVLVDGFAKDSPAAHAGLAARDQILSIADASGSTAITSAAQLSRTARLHAGQTVGLTYSHEGAVRTARVALNSAQAVAASQKTAHPIGYLGVSLVELQLTRATWSAPIVAAGLLWQFTAATFHALGAALSALFQGHAGTASQQVSGPVGIVVGLHYGSTMGYQFVLLIVGLISLSLAIMNLLPVPALDGGRFYVLLLSRIFGKRLSKDMEERIVGASFVFLLLLIGLITVVDVKRFF